MNNCTLPEFVAWAQKELCRPGLKRVGHYALFDMRMLSYFGVMIPSAECTSNIATLTNEHRPSYSLQNLAQSHNLGSKDDAELHDWMVRHLQQFKLKPTRSSCAPHYWRVPVEIMAPYAKHDPVLTLRYYNAAYPELITQNVERVYRLECDLMPTLVRMHLCGVRADLPRVRRLQSELKDRIAELNGRWRDMCGGRVVNANSPLELKVILDEIGLKYPLTPKTKQPQIKKEWLEAIEHPLGNLVRSIRQTKYYSNTSLENYILGNLDDGEDVIHGEFHPLKGDQYGTVTGRFSSGGGLNLQNIPARDEYWGPLLRSVFRPMRDDQQWLKVDYSQIEYRFFAHYAGLRARILKTRGEGDGISAMEQAYINNPSVDFHQWVADTADIKRKRAKNVNFCRLYGGGIAKIALTAGCTVEEAKEFVGKYDERIPEAKQLMDDITDSASKRGYIRTWYGRRCRLLTEGQMASKYGTQPRGAPGKYAKAYTATNKCFQGSAADLIKLAMVELDRSVIDWDGTQLHLQVHDELDFSVPLGAEGEKKRDEIVEIMQEVGKTPMWNGEIMRVPVIAEADLGPNWGMLP
jgi:DNA polymerase-1